MLRVNNSFLQPWHANQSRIGHVSPSHYLQPSSGFVLAVICQLGRLNCHAAFRWRFPSTWHLDSDENVMRSVRGEPSPTKGTALGMRPSPVLLKPSWNRRDTILCWMMRSWAIYMVRWNPGRSFLKERPVVESSVSNWDTRAVEGVEIVIAKTCIFF